MSTITCPNCKAKVPSGAFCDNCGIPLNVAAELSEPVHCPNCGAEAQPGDAFCGNCGMTLTAVRPDRAEVAPGICPNCGAAVQIDDRFCDNCGHDLLPASGFPESPQVPAAEPANPGSVLSITEHTDVEGDIVLRGEHIPDPDPVAAPLLLVQPSGTRLALPPNKEDYIIGREDPASGSYPDVDLVPFGGEEGGVSRRHARITRDGRQFFIEDLNSVNYTFVNKQKIPVGAAHPIHDGDEIRLGRVLLRFKAG